MANTFSVVIAITLFPENFFNLIHTVLIRGIKGKKLNVKKAIVAKSKIQELSKDFGGSLSDKDLMAIVGVSRNTYYKYKREIMIERVG